VINVVDPFKEDTTILSLCASYKIPREYQKKSPIVIQLFPVVVAMKTSSVSTYLHPHELRHSYEKELAVIFAFFLFPIDTNEILGLGLNGTATSGKRIVRSLAKGNLH
jgi:hypothetical protein